MTGAEFFLRESENSFIQRLTQQVDTPNLFIGPLEVPHHFQVAVKYLNVPALHRDREPRHSLSEYLRVRYFQV